MSFRVVRQSKYRHVFGKPQKKDEVRCCPPSLWQLKRLPCVLGRPASRAENLSAATAGGSTNVRCQRGHTQQRENSLRVAKPPGYRCTHGLGAVAALK